jgi:methionine sulfoxide reductase heme-binding subunit
VLGIGTGRKTPGRPRRNIAIAIAGVTACVVALRFYPDRAPSYAVSLATAYLSLACLTGALVIGPFQVLAGRRSPLSSNLRRDLGIWTAIFALVHVAFGLAVHMGGRIAEYFFRPLHAGAMPIPRIDAFGLANDVGLVATAILIMLLAISSNRALRTLGAQRWKAWQRWSYVAAVATALHAAVYQLLDHRDWPFVAACWVLFGAMLTLQNAARRRRLANHDQAPREIRHDGS